MGTALAVAVPEHWVIPCSQEILTSSSWTLRCNAYRNYDIVEFDFVFVVYWWAVYTTLHVTALITD